MASEPPAIYFINEQKYRQIIIDDTMAISIIKIKPFKNIKTAKRKYERALYN